MTLEPIGLVVNGVAGARDAGWGEVVSEIRLRPELADGLFGLDEFSHAVVVFFLHKSGFDPASQLRRHPRERADLPKLGIFAQRARHRPNPIAITTVAIVRSEGASLFVRGLDAIDGTPVLDLKPHFPDFDSPRSPRVPEWVGRLMAGYF
jgi:tRNA-Thr(GGU) m(6)t(6)A37 methyltransferase TsaA